MKELAMRSIMNGEPVWMGCDVGKMMRRDLGLWDRNLFDYEGVYHTTFTLDKASRLVYHQTAMTHAILFTGVDVVNNRPRRWRVDGGCRGSQSCSPDSIPRSTREAGLGSRRHSQGPAQNVLPNSGLPRCRSTHGSKAP